MNVPLFDPTPELEKRRNEINTAINTVFEHGQFILGPEVTEFEQRAAAYLGVKHAVGVNSGTDALVIALRTAGVGPGDEVITTPFSFFATAESISMVGAKPVFADIDGATYNIQPGKIQNAISENTKAIMPVHLFGFPADMKKIMEIAKEHDLKVIEDCAQSFGATYNGQQTGSIGHAGAFSFFPTKNLGGAGDGGLITTDDDKIAEQGRMLRAHGSNKKYHNEMLGYNSRLDTLQAAILLVKLQYLDENNEQRKKIAQYYESNLPASGIRLPCEAIAKEGNPQSAPGHVYHQYTIRVLNGQRDKIREQLTQKGISTGVYYPVPQHQLPVYEGQYGSLPVSEQLAGEVLSLPMFPGMSEEQQDYVIETLRRLAV